MQRPIRRSGTGNFLPSHSMKQPLENWRSTATVIDGSTCDKNHGVHLVHLNGRKVRKSSGPPQPGPHWSGCRIPYLSYVAMYLVGAQKLVHILSGTHGIVPAAKQFVRNEVKSAHFRV